MSKQTARKKAAYEDLCKLPDNMVGEIINGELVSTPRPRPEHVLITSSLGGELGPPYQFGRGGPGGWWILDEPELHLGEHVLVPDLAGWRKERMPEMPKEAWFSIPPDWVCEVLSPSSAGRDCIEKAPIYAEHGVKYMWLLQPEHRRLEIYSLARGRWTLVAKHTEEEKVRGAPFGELQLDLSLLWA